MAGGKNKIHEHPNAGKNGLHKNPQNINRKGQPRKLFSTVNKELLEKGIEPLSKAHLLEAYSLIFNSDKKELDRIAEDDNVPYALRLIIQELEDKNNRMKALADYRDYMFGKAKQEIDNNHKVTEYKFTSNLGV